MFERLRAAINAALDAATPPPDLRELAGQMHQAVVELRAAVVKMRSDYLVTQQHLQAEKSARDDADRRGKLAAGINDRETVDVAERFVAKHNERVSVLEQKLAAQTAELGLAERELADMTAQLKRLDRERPQGPGVAAPPDPEEDRLKGRMDRVMMEAAADEQLKALKRKMGK